MPKVSVVIPTFNRPALLMRSVESALRQTVEDLEVVVVIDGPDPATVAALERNGDKRLRYIQHEKQMGAGQTRDDGARSSNAEWVAFLDDDDEWTPDKLETQFSLPLTPKTIVVSRTEVVMPEGTFIWPTRVYDASEPIDEWLFDRKAWFKETGSWLQTSSLMTPRALFDVLGFAGMHHEEWEISIRSVKQHGYQLLTALEPTVIHYRTAVATSLSGKQRWPQSLVWLDGLGDLLTPRAYSGFCLLNISRSAADAGDRSAIPVLWKAAWRKGKPTPQQCFAFAMMWLLPPPTRRRLRGLISRDRQSRPA